MCSIFGSLNLDFNPSDIFDIMRGRGPDFEKSEKVDNWTFCHQRLAILGLTASGNQPMHRNGNTIVFNGEIYNFKELKKQFCQDENFLSSSDTEVLLCLLNKYGIDIINKLNGMFAFVYYDAKQKKTFVARDRYGVKPCYYWKKDNMFVFSSNILPILKVTGENYTFNPVTVEKYLDDTATDFDENTLIENINQVCPGQYLVVDQNATITKHQWYNNNDCSFQKSDFKNNATIISNFEDILSEAIKIRNRADVDVGITLSGGVDSSIIYILAKEKFKTDYKVFTLANNDENINEFAVAARLAGEYGDTIHKIQDVEKDWEIFIKSLQALEYPIWSFSHIGYYNVYNAIKQNGCKVILEGHGSDELLGGWPYTLSYAYKQEIGQLHFSSAYEIYQVQQEVFNKNLNQKDKKKNRIRFAKEIKRILLNPKNWNAKPFDELLESIFQYRILPISLRCFDRMTSANSLESRAPFMDVNVVEYLRKIPVHNKVNHIGNKAILREIIKKYGKSYIYLNKQKLGFSSSELNFINNPENNKKLLEAVSQSPYISRISTSTLNDLKNHKISWGYDGNLYRVISLQILQNLFNRKN